MTGNRKRLPARVLFFWDYDTQWGADRSRNPTRTPDWGALEFPNTDLVLEAHARHGIPACFAVVGAAALPGERPYHDPAQIRRIHEEGHEVASHSFRHEWLPALGGEELRETLRTSKDALEQCIGAEVSTFVPPYNQPFDLARRGSISLSERRAVRRHRTDIGRLCTALAETGYRFCRVAYRPLAMRLAALAGRHQLTGSALETIHGIVCVRLNTPGGFGPEIRRAIESDEDGRLWVLYGHPHSVRMKESAQSLCALERTLGYIAEWRCEGRIRCTLPRELIHPERS